jgi:asparagine synthase (glutamine-hydrolysing)
MVSPEASYAITCDGRVDNREELLRNLRPLAFVSSTASDAALILHAYQVWGTACLRYIVGDFAFALWDGVKRELFCARDRLGIRPFYYYSNSQCFVFGSEINSLSQHPDVPHQLNEEMAGLYLSGAISDGEQTFYKGILQLPAGHFLAVNDRGVSKHLYWELEPDRPVVLASEEEYVQRFRELFEEAVQCRLRSNTPVASTLSGGLDSSSIYCIAQSLLKTRKAPSGQVHAFSSVFSEFDTADESKYINAVLDDYPAPSHLVNSDGYWSFKPLQGSYPQPSHPFPIPHQARHEALLQKIHEQGIRVELSGEGGDEILFVQAQPYFWHLLVNRQWSRLHHDLKSVNPGWRRGFYSQVLYSLAPGWTQGVYHRARGRPTGRTDDYSIISDEFARRINLDQLIDETLAPKSFKSPHWAQQHNMVQSFSRTFFLSYGSQAAHWHGVEARFPFLDSRLVDFVGRVPPEYKVVREGLTKWLLRQAMKGVLPELVRQRPDKGDFSPLFHRGLNEMGEHQLRHVIEHGHLARLGLVDQARLSRLLSQSNLNDKYPVMRFISFFTLEQWLQQHFAGGGGSIPTQRALPIFLQKGGEDNAHL